jgi:hypothetical protein
MTFHVLYEERDGTRYLVDVRAKSEAVARAMLRKCPNHFKTLQIDRVKWVDKKEADVAR